MKKTWSRKSRVRLPLTICLILDRTSEEIITFSVWKALLVEEEKACWQEKALGVAPRNMNRIDILKWHSIIFSYRANKEEHKLPFPLLCASSDRADFAITLDKRRHKIIFSFTLYTFIHDTTEHTLSLTGHIMTKVRATFSYNIHLKILSETQLTCLF